jgi:acetyl-CoA carboxylase carboxyltransferase component
LINCHPDTLYVVFTYLSIVCIWICRGGILEPEGTVEIKFRIKDLSKTMQRLDPVCSSLVRRISSPDVTRADRQTLEKQLKEREEQLLPMYHQVAVMFADLHDMPGRMQEKGCISVSDNFCPGVIVFVLNFKVL